MDYKDVADAILKGELDAYFDAIKEAMRMRKESLSAVAFYSFNIGDKVRYVPSTRPTYLAGRTGTIKSIKRKKVIVDLDTPSGRFYTGIATPVDLIEKI